jgi:predicted permease
MEDEVAGEEAMVNTVVGESRLVELLCYTAPSLARAARPSQRNHLSSVLLLLPDFLLIILGALLYRFAPFQKTMWSSLEEIVYFVLFPSLLFQSTSTANFHAPGTGWLIVAGFIATLAGILLGWLFIVFFKAASLDFASALQTAFRFNSYLALAAATRLGGTQGTALMAILLGLNVPLANIAAVHALARNSESHALKLMLRNPLIIATFLGLASNLLGLVLPEPITTTLGRLGSASIALGLMTVGAGLRLGQSRRHLALKSWMLSVRLLVIPAVTFSLALLMPLSPLQFLIVVLFAALPSASSAYILAVRMGGNGPLVAWLVSIGTVLSAVTLPAWLTLARVMSHAASQAAVSRAAG